MNDVDLPKLLRRARIHFMTTPHVTPSSHTTDVLLAGGVLSYSHMLGCDLTSPVGKTMLLWQSSLFIVANKILGTGGVSDRPYQPIPAFNKFSASVVPEWPAASYREPRAVLEDDLPELPFYKSLFVDTGDYKLDPEVRHSAPPSLNGDAPPPRSPITFKYVNDWRKRYGYQTDSDDEVDSDPERGSHPGDCLRRGLNLQD
jgi:hypothetical protein